MTHSPPVCDRRRAGSVGRRGGVLKPNVGQFINGAQFRTLHQSLQDHPLSTSQYLSLVLTRPATTPAGTRKHICYICQEIIVITEHLCDTKILVLPYVTTVATTWIGLKSFSFGNCPSLQTWQEDRVVCGKRSINQPIMKLGALSLLLAGKLTLDRLGHLQKRTQDVSSIFNLN